ncbi:hypothetical protein DSS3P1_17 [Ruegeria phage DSS3-P1]|uniref:hypothetical protein n=1 Tax=Ruegeria phage DSS3-P1 TaxID=1555208 RepID=UPI0002357D55|nr:hypothetical protein DSS3P1_17 [Ruegeria phage DSS3-P1]YP_009997234.1 hypothetical protein JT312_gp17 [Ruegeria phage vB_RpoS-V18]YP_009997316.1 hypothetical protein JT313_gp17 [Ruegeria phage vB_RpoS-V11]YP_009997399.1 hypothetical protein JT314_gp18 [Ruegeria phage vB_RpoS-V7]AET42319.1 hypothetical protein SDSG_00054 [Ruegeria phage DSS3-P1]AIT13252.1 hypothetical protein DSS3P1_17 [Ruegeria phage DSS3-P1]AWY08721.1 hypothetical protein vBRpoSV7_18 [Ruegeria phage vB_RpoS-V7]AWY08893.1
MKTVKQNRSEIVTHQEERERLRAMLARGHLNAFMLERKIDNGVHGLSGWIVLNIRLWLTRRSIARIGRRLERHTFAGFRLYQENGW